MPDALRSLLALALLGTLLPACTGTAADSAGIGEAAPVADLPPIHVEQTAELLVEGDNQARAFYRQTVDACEAGGLPTRRLSPAEVEKIGTTRYEMWFTGDAEVFRTRSWEVASDGPAGSCLFRLEETGSYESEGRTTRIAIDLATGAREQSAQAPDALLRYPVAAEDDAVAPGFNGPSERSVAGQPCREWVSTLTGDRQCLWAAGRQWGFGSTALNDHRPGPDHIVLEQQPGNGNGYRVTTQVMTVGQPFELPAPAQEGS